MPAMLSRRVSLCGAVFLPGGSSLTISQIRRPISDGGGADQPERSRASRSLAVAKASGAVAQAACRASRLRAASRPGSKTAPAGTSGRRAQAAPSGTRRCRSQAARAPRPARRRVAAIANRAQPSTVNASRHQDAELGTETVERHAERQLRGGKAEEIDARQQPDLDRREPDLGRQIGRDHADRIAQELADDVEHAERATTASRSRSMGSSRARARIRCQSPSRPFLPVRADRRDSICSPVHSSAKADDPVKAHRTCDSHRNMPILGCHALFAGAITTGKTA